MKVSPIALEKENISGPSVRDRFQFWIDKGHSFRSAASRLNRGERDLLAYINNRFQGDIVELEKDISALLQRGDDAKAFPLENPTFCKTSIAAQIWGALSSASRDSDMGVIAGPAGCGKSEALKEFKRRHQDVILITVNVTTKIGSLLFLIAEKMAATSPDKSGAALLASITRALIRRPCFLVIDESHFLDWKSLEALRAIHDATKTGIVLSGQPEIFARILGGEGYSQLLSRLGTRLILGEVTKEDIRLVCDSIFPGLDDRCLNFLYGKAVGVGTLRTTTKLLGRAIRVSERKKAPLTVSLLKQVAEAFLL